MKKSNRKGFTIVELVIVIAVIAILAAVLIPTFSNLIKKANESSDVQAVRQMNTILAAENAFVGGITINDAVKALKEAGFNGDKYVPLVSGRYFFYDQDTKQIVYTEYKDGNYNVLFPKDATIEGHSIFSLSGDVAKKDYAAPTLSEDKKTATFSISSAEEYAQLAADFKDLVGGKDPEGLAGFEVTLCESSAYIKGVANKTIVINLTEDIDLKGASFNLNLTNCTFILNGNGKTISGIVNNSGFAVSSGNDENKAAEYGGAFLGYVSASTIEFKDVTFKNCRFGSETVKGSAVFVGQLNGASSVTFKNTNVVDCTVGGLKGVAVYVGHACANGEQDIKFEGTNTVNGCELTAASKEADEVALVGIISGRVSGTNKTVSGTAPTISGLTIIAAGATVENADSRWIVNTGDSTAVDGEHVVKTYTGSWTNKQ